MLTSILKSYSYTQYNDDPNIIAFINAYNQCAQSFLDSFNALNLPIYTQPPVSGLLLDWVGQGIYGIMRPYLPATNTSGQLVGPLNTVVLNRIPLNAFTSIAQAGYVAVNDDVYRRVITWDFYKGDGVYFTTRWLKRRIARFIYGNNGTDMGTDDTSAISVTYPGSNSVVVTLAASLANAGLFKQAIDNGLLQLPFQKSFSVVLV